MFKMRNRLLQRLSTIAAALVLVGATVPSVGAAPAAQTAADPKTLVIGTPFAIKSFDPGRAYEQTVWMIHKATYNTLVTLDENDISVIVPDLATSWEISPDAKTFTFHLRQGVKFQTSGNTTTSADVKWPLERAIPLKGNPPLLLVAPTTLEAPTANRRNI